MMPSHTASPVNVRLPEGVSAARAAAKAADLGLLPEWDLSDLYSGLDAPEFAADMTRAEEECRRFSEAYAGRSPRSRPVRMRRRASPRRCAPTRRSRICWAS